MRRAALGALVAALVLLASGCLNASVRDWAAEHLERQPNQGSAAVYTAQGPPTQVADRIADAREPAERRVTASGVFLRYHDDIVGVVPDPDGGSRVLIEDADRGYVTFFPYIGGFWGTFSGGPGEGFRGGGPGAGK